MPTFQIVLFEGFETLDAMWPAEVIGGMDAYAAACFSAGGGIVSSRQAVGVATRPLSDCEPGGVLLIPGGFGGVQDALGDDTFVDALRRCAEGAEAVLAVCTAALLLAATGLLDGRRATTHAQVLERARALRGPVCWRTDARWFADGKFYTSSGVRAGMDMVLGFLAARHGREVAEARAALVEYDWRRSEGEEGGKP